MELACPSVGDVPGRKTKLHRTTLDKSVRQGTRRVIRPQVQTRPGPKLFSGPGFINFHQFSSTIRSAYCLQPLFGAKQLFRRQHWWGPWFVKVQKIPLTRDHSCAKMQSSPIKICHDVMVQNTSTYCKHLDLVSDRFFPRSQHLAATSPSNKPSNGAGTSGHGSGTGIPGGSSRPWCNNRSWNIIEATNLSRPGWTTKDWTSKDVPPPKVASLHGLPGSTLVTLPPCICRISTHTSFQTDSTWSTSRLCATPFRPLGKGGWWMSQNYQGHPEIRWFRTTIPCQES